MTVDELHNLAESVSAIAQQLQLLTAQMVMFKKEEIEVDATDIKQTVDILGEFTSRAERAVMGQ